MVPALDAGEIVRELRLKYDPSAAAGVPPHVTLMYPFLPADQLTDDVRSTLAALFASTPAFHFALTGLRRFPQGVLYLEPVPAEPFVQVTAGIGNAFGLVPFAGEFGAVAVPHLTIAVPESGATEREIVEQLRAANLPRHLRAEEAWLMVGNEVEGWQTLSTLPFGGTTQAAR